MEHRSANLPPPESSPEHSCVLIRAKFRWQGSNPPLLSTSELWSRPRGQPIALWQINSLRQTYGTISIPGAIPLKSPGFLTWERYKDYCIKADFFFFYFLYFFHLPLYESAMSSSAHDLFMLSHTFKLCGFIHFFNLMSFYAIVPSRDAQMISQQRKNVVG